MSSETTQGVQFVSPDAYQGMTPSAGLGATAHSRATPPAFDGEDFPLGPACDLSGEGICDSCQ